MRNIPENLYYTDSHEWVKQEDEVTAKVGVTDHAQHSMGDMVYVELPEVGIVINAGEECGVLESVKSASDFYLPLSGEIIEVNKQLSDTPELVNKDPYEQGWLMKVKLSNPGEIENLLSATKYRELLEKTEG